jgi:hypothetical protein
LEIESDVRDRQVSANQVMKRILLTFFLMTIPALAESNLVKESDLPIAAVDPGAPVKIQVTPADFTITGSRQRVQFVVTGNYENAESADLTRIAKYEIADPDIARIDDRGSVTPLADGQTTILIKAGGQTAVARINVGAEPQPVSFHNHALAVFARAGCSTGGCHGAPHGKGGFRLSLFASNPALDAQTIVREEFGRRVNLLEPESSLLLAKPQNRIAHEGGKRLEKGELDQQLLIDWIAEGCAIDSDAPKCVGIEITPGSNVFRRRPHHVQQFRVEAKFEDGAVRDVTHLAVFQSSDETVCKVSRRGLAVGLRRGEAAVIVRYLEQLESTLVSFVDNVENFVWSAPEPANYIDEHVHAKLRQFQYLPSELCSDEVFLRRVHLDVTGLLPTPDAALYFLDNSDPDKRAKLIDELLESKDHAAFWAQKWGDLLKLSTKQIGHKGVYKFHRWIHEAVAENRPYDEFARQILLASGSNLTNPQTNYYRSGSDTSDIMESTSQLFLGTRIACAKCHNHPYEAWTQDNYYGLSAFFNRITTKKIGKSGEVVVWTKPGGEVKHPATGAEMQPWAPGAGELPIEAEADRREAFATWLTSEKNPFFARVEVNRIWTHLMGRGIVEPFDDFRDSNPPANAKLLDALAVDFVAHGFDRKHVIRRILSSRTYQASSAPNDSNRDDVRFASHQTPRRLSAEQLLDAICDITGVAERFAFAPNGMRATQLPAPDLKPHVIAEIGNTEFLKTFGQPERQTVCECERGYETSLGQALELFNGQTIQSKLTSPENRFQKAVAQNADLKTVIAELYLRAFTRRPSEREMEIALNYVDGAGDKAKAFEDLVWAVINRDEFLFQH